MTTTTKTKTKKKKKKKTSARKTTAKKAAASTKPARTPAKKVASACPRGGTHKWTSEGDERFCEKCHEPAPATGKAKAKVTTPKKAKGDASPKEKKLSAIDAASRVLADSKEPLNCKQLVEAMAEKKLWTSPGGKTPHATLYSAILREIGAKGKDAQFKKAERGKFVANA
jgi:hypothetical protein